MTERPTVSTTSGRLRGYAEGGVYGFRGVPYAAPPVGALRWQAARPHPGWDGVRDAAEYGPTAPQPWRPEGLPVIGPLVGSHGEPPFDEDCLTLNLWTPGVDDRRRPVLVWIHGGGFMTGSGNLPYYAGDRFASDGDIVAISINYRLGPLGFLSGVGDANCWLSDQVAALQWIVDNVAAFGGDPSRITLAGQSGGAFSIAALAQHPEARSQFQRGILQSPPLGLDLPGPQEAVARTRSLARHLGHRDIQALGDETWERLILGAVAVLGEFAEFGEWSVPFYPVVDAATLPRPPIAALADADADLIIGWTRDEATFAFGTDPRHTEASRDEVTAWASKRHGRRAEALYDEYAAASGKVRPVDVLAQIVTDELFRCGARRVVQERAARRPVYAYQFELASPMLDGAIGATHCLELPFTFANIDRWASAPFIQGLEAGMVARVTDALHDAWIGFVRQHEPVSRGLPFWPAYRADDAAIAVVGDDIRIVRDIAAPPVCAE